MKSDRDPMIARFQELYLDEFGETIDDREAYERLTRLTNVLRALSAKATTEGLHPPGAMLDDTPQSGTLSS